MSSHNLGVDCADNKEEEDIQNEIMVIVEQIKNEMLTYGDDKLNSMDHDVVDFETQKSRILRIFQIGIEKIELGFCLPCISKKDLNESKLEPDELENLKQVFMKYDQDYYQNLDENPSVTNSINAVYNKGLWEKTPKYIEMLPEAERNFIRLMKELKSLIEWRLTMTAPKAMAKEKTLHKMWIENEKRKVRIEEIKTLLETERSNYEVIATTKDKSVEQKLATIRDLEEHCRQVISNEIESSHKTMNKICLNSKVKQEELARNTLKTKQKYESMLALNLKNGKTMRENKLKTQQKLQNWLNKYDTEIGNRSRELFNLQDELELEKEKYAEWIHNFDEQEEIYEVLMAEKHVEDMKIREEKLLIFLINRAARIIQNAWREFLKFRKKKKKKGGKKGKS